MAPHRPEKPPCLRKHLPYGLLARQPLEREKQDCEAEQKRPFRARQRDQKKQDRRPEERRVPLVQEGEGAPTSSTENIAVSMPLTVQ